MLDLLTTFSPPVADWFRATYRAPTPPQASGWPVIARGDHALIVSPTGSGKTLTAFLWSIDRLFRELQETPEPARGSRASTSYRPGVRVVYVSPLKALNNDVQRNLDAPLSGIRATAETLGASFPELRVAVRTGDTPSNERQKMLRRPPHILITTPESLYLMLTSSRARALFATTHTVIVDEIHTLIGTKRGAHLALSLERLNRLGDGGLQRIGLSATVRPLDNAARFLGGQSPDHGFAPRPVTVVDASYVKPIDLRVVLPVEDFRDAPGNSIWPAIIPEVAQLIDSHRTTLIFCNNRRLAERTADRLNEQRLREREGTAGLSESRGGTADLGIFAAGVDPSRLEAAGIQSIRAHHGSMSKVARLDMERALQSGRLPALVCTSSLELGIDVGEIDLVVHLQSPKSVASGLQRIGRSGHLVGQTSVGRIFPTHADDLIEAAAVCRGMLRGEIETTETPENPLDVLAQQIVAMVSVEDWTMGEALALARSAYPFRELGESVFRGVVEMLSGKYPESISRQLKARIAWDRVNDRLTALPGSSTLAIGSGGTIPDRGAYALVLRDRHTRVGELDEEFVFETRPGDTFLLGTNVWRVLDVTEDRVVAEPAPGEIPRMPFWRGDAPWRPYDLGQRVGAFRRELAAMVRALTPADLETVREIDARTLASIVDDVGELPDDLTPSVRHLLTYLGRECALDRNAIVQIVEHVARQLDVVGQIASDRTVVVEVFEDAIGDPRMVVHSPFGGRVNGPWSIALAGTIRERLGVEAQIISGDDGFLLRFANADVAPPVDLVGSITSREVRERLLAELPGSATFGAQFRMNAARALLLPRERAGRRTPLWLSRLRAKDLLQAVQQLGDFPILLETFRDCLRDVMDLAGLTDVLDRIQRGEIEVVVHDADVPSPVAVNLDYRFAMQYVYEYDAPRGERQLAALTLDRDLLADLLRDGSLAELLKPEAVAEVTARVGKACPQDHARDVEELAQVLFELGDLSESEILARCGNADGRDWLQRLVETNRALPWRFGQSQRWIHAERRSEYAELAVEPAPVLRRFLAHAGPTSLLDLARRFALSPQATERALAALGRDVASGRFVAGGAEQWIDRRNLEQMHRRTINLLRREVQPVSIYAYADFLRRWHGIDENPERLRRNDPMRTDESPADDAAQLIRVLQQLRGLAIPGVILERDVLPARVPNFDPADLAERCQSGDLQWVVDGGRDAHRARICLFFRGEGGLFLDRRPDESALTSLGEAARSVYEFLTAEGAALLADVAEGTDLSRADAQVALVDLVLAGLVTNDSLDGLHAILGYEPPRQERDRPRSSLEVQLAALLPHPRATSSRRRLREARRRAREVAATNSRAHRTPWLGRWSIVHRPTLLGKPLPDDERSLRQARQLLDRWGVVTKACLDRESPVLDWSSAYVALSHLEMRGEVRRGYFVEGLPGIQFARSDAIERLRSVNGEQARGADSAMPARGAETRPLVVLNAADPAQLFGTDDAGGPLRFPRTLSSAVALAAGQAVAVMTDGGAGVIGHDHPDLPRALRALAAWWLDRGQTRIRVHHWNGEPVLDSPGALLLEAAGFVRDYDGMLWLK